MYYMDFLFAQKDYIIGQVKRNGQKIQENEAADIDYTVRIN